VEVQFQAAESFDLQIEVGRKEAEKRQQLLYFLIVDDSMLSIIATDIDRASSLLVCRERDQLRNF